MISWAGNKYSLILSFDDPSLERLWHTDYRSLQCTITKMQVNCPPFLDLGNVNTLIIERRSIS
jgi:hypothetical protein